ncbi:alpha-glucosidase domain-containing protein [Mucilaginibacter sp. SG564]|uniref:alpha-glucosidase domain-containing protein n=1 Tax=Mucilaginibacter sp. SG564 TaxID=2587022 RepID=UPI0020A65154|nr:alpha-glucosidase domain-containing protein [Mucilaginibacter sp. SG564]NOW93355.1 alpha-glucosidase (family GH31 glycosyl hydrolase) [Mucilaginibacter sp. SG564]
MLKRVLLYVCTIFSAALFTHAAAQGIYKKVTDGIIVSLPQKSAQDSRLLRLQVISDKIIHVTATPESSFPRNKSLMALDRINSPVNWNVVQKGNQLLLSTASVTAHVLLPQGIVSFTDKAGKLILSENAERTFTLVSNNGESSYHIIQNFNSPANEAIYGLGQHQNGVVNFKNQHLELLQNNTEVAVPFLVSNKNYGILWDNYSLTKFGDTRDLQSISGLKLFAADGSEGWLTATYAKKADSTNVFIQRPESDIDYSFLEDMKNFPQGYKLGEGKVSWDRFDLIGLYG